MTKVLKFPTGGREKTHEEILAKVASDAEMFGAAYEMYWFLKQLSECKGFRDLCSEPVLQTMDGIIAKAERKRTPHWFSERAEKKDNE